MAGISKVTYGDELLLDLTQDTVNPNVLLAGFTAHAANGDPIGGALVLGALAYLSSISYNSPYLTDKPTLGDLATLSLSDLNLKELAHLNLVDLNLKALSHLNSISYNSQYLTDRPRLGALSSLDYIEWSSSYLTNKPDFHKLAFQDFIDYESNQLKNKPVFGDLAWLDKISYESDQITDKPMPLNEVIGGLSYIYPDLPKGIQLFSSLAAGDFWTGDLLYYSEEGMHVRDQYSDWFTVIEGSTETCIRITIKENLSDFVKPILGDIAYQNKIDYNSSQIVNKPDFGELAFQDLIDYDSDQIINKPPTAAEILKAILDIYPDIPIGIPFAVNAAAESAFCFPEGVFSYVTEGIRFDPSNTSGISSSYVSQDYGVRFIFPPFQFIPDVPDDNKVYARRHGEWVEITM